VSGTPGASGVGAIVARVDVDEELLVVEDRRTSLEVVDSTTCGAKVVATGRSAVTDGGGAAVSGVVGNGSKLVVGKGSCASLRGGDPTTAPTKPTAPTITNRSRRATTTGA